jgi:hypothetical protein
MLQNSDYTQFSRNSLDNFEKEIIKKTENIKPFLSRYYSTIPTVTYQYVSEVIFTILKTSKDPLEIALCKWFLTNAESLETSHALGGFLCFKFLLAAIKETKKLPEDFQRHKIKKLWNEQLFNELCFHNRKPFTKENISLLLNQWCKDKKNFVEALTIAIDMAGMEGNISIEENDTISQNSFLVEKKFGYNFNSVETPPGIISPTKFWEHSNVKIMCIDGFIDRVSEIDKILQKSFETKIPLVIFAMGFHEEVMSTILLNTAQKKFNIVPIKLSSNLSGLNVNNDIAVVTGAKIVSVVNGDLLSLVNYDDLAIVEKVSITQNNVVINNNQSTKEVTAHIFSLLEKRKKNQNIIDISTLYDDRIKSLVTNHVIIKQSKQKTAVGNRLDADNILRLIKSSTRYGFIEIKELQKILEDSEENFTTAIMKEAIKNIDISMVNFIPTTSLIFAGKVFQEGILNFLSSSGIVSTALNVKSL